MKSLILKRIGCLLIATAIILATVPVEKVNANKSSKSDFQIADGLLVKYTGTADVVSVPDGVEKIGEEAFAGNSDIKSLKLPNSLQTISYSAFSDCSSLESVEIPKSVTVIDNSAFSNCKSLNSFSVKGNLEHLGAAVFAGCDSLEEVSFAHDSEYVFDKGIIYKKDKSELIEVLKGAGLTNVEIPDSVENILPYAFYGCGSINNVTLSNSLSEIPPHSFSYCFGLNKLTIPYKVSSIDAKAFENCVNLEKVIMSERVNSIHSTAFDGCFGLEIEAPASSYAHKWYDEFVTTDVVLPDEDIDFLLKLSKYNISVPYVEKQNVDEKDMSLSNVGSNDVSGNNIGNSNDEKQNSIGETRIVGRKAVILATGDEYTKAVEPTPSPSQNEIEPIEEDESIADIVQKEVSQKGMSLPHFSVFNNEIAGKAFYADDTLSSFKFDGNIVKIGDFAFARTPINNVEINDGVESIGYGAFYHCDNLSKIVVPKSVKYIGANAFAHTRMLENWSLYGKDDFLILGDGVLVAYKGNDSNVTIPSNVKTIAPQVFKNHKEIVYVDLGENVSDIGDEAFLGCSNLRKIVYPDCRIKIRDRAFMNCGLQTVVIPDNVYEMGAGVFDDTVGECTIVFMGDIIPKFSVEKTTTRLANDEYRISPAGSMDIAVINNSDILLKNTVLDKECSGFDGVILVVDDERGECSIVNGNMNKARELNGETIDLSGKKYYVKDIFNVIETDADESDDDYFSFPGVDGKFACNIAKIDNDELICEAYRKIYSQVMPEEGAFYNISIKDVYTGINISKLGEQTYKVSLPLPKNMSTNNLHIFSVDEYNQPEDLSFVTLGKNGDMSVEFNVSHTGNYYLYNINSQYVLTNPDDTPKTGDINIHPKWFLCVGMFSAGLLLLLIKK